jgi:hypothetical protein
LGKKVVCYCSQDWWTISTNHPEFDFPSIATYIARLGEDLSPFQQHLSDNGLATYHFDAVSEPTQTPQRQWDRPRIYSNDEWEDRRQTFEKLYILEDKPLKVVAKIMSDEHGFHAT